MRKIVTPDASGVNLAFTDKAWQTRQHHSQPPPPIADASCCNTSSDAYAYSSENSMSRSTSQVSTATTNTSSHGRTLPTKINTKAQPPPSIVSDVKLFVTNLRLLDFDLRNDWPGITVQTFSAKNADQRQRISGTEWALFRLFEIWDPNETAQVCLDANTCTLAGADCV